MIIKIVSINYANGYIENEAGIKEDIEKIIYILLYKKIYTRFILPWYSDFQVINFIFVLKYHKYA